MHTELQEAVDVASLPVAGALTIYEVGRLKEELLKALREHACLDIDVSAVTEVDGAGVQLLALLHREALRANKPLRIVGGSPAWTRLVSLLGMRRYFGGSLLGPEGESDRSEPGSIEHELRATAANIF